MKSSSVGVLIMAYGSAPSLDDQAIFRYLQHILQYYRKKEPTQEEFQNLKERYHSVGGSPLYSVTEKIAEALQDALNLSFPERFRVDLAMKHSPPFIEDRVSQMAETGVKQAIAVALAPFRSRLSTEGYYRLVRESNKAIGRAHPVVIRSELEYPSPLLGALEEPNRGDSPPPGFNPRSHFHQSQSSGSN